MSGNTADGLGGGIYNEDYSVVKMSGEASVTGNSAGSSGGGIYGGMLTGAVAGVNLLGNMPDDIAP